MGRYFLIAGCAVVAFHFGGLTSGEVLAWVAGYLAGNRVALLASGLLGVLGLCCGSLLFGGIGFFNILYVVAKGIYELVQLLLCAMALGAMIFWFDLGANLWLEGGGTLAIILYAWLYGAAFSLRVFDFNYPLKDVLFSYTVLPFVCLAVIWVSGLIR
jgi:hypothetical protein